MRRALLMLAMLALAIAGTGCAKPPGVIFPPLPKPIVWPAPPERPRIRYVGQIATSADLKPAVPFTQAVGVALFGKKPIHSMLTPMATCTDVKERLFVADSNAQVVHVFNLKTRAYDQWRPQGTAKHFSQPVGIAWDPAGRLFVADAAAGCVFIFDNSGKQIGQLIMGLSRPCGLAFEPRTGRLFVADSGTHQVVIFSPAGMPTLYLGGRGTEPGRFNYPTNVAVDSQGRLYVSDSLNFRVQQYDPTFRTVRQIGRKGDMPGYFSQPKGMALDSQDHLYVVDAQFESVQIFDANGSLLLDFGQEGRGPGEFWLPAGVFIGKDRIWIADSYNRRVQVFDYLPEARHP